MDGGWNDQEAIEAERFDADIEQAAFEAAGRVYARQRRASAKAAAAGDFLTACEICPHGAGYPLHSQAARNENDPLAYSPGYDTDAVRCTECRGVIEGFRWEIHGRKPRVLSFPSA
jgi:hypothetical protein